jgi:hypothetical protein
MQQSMAGTGWFTLFVLKGQHYCLQVTAQHAQVTAGPGVNVMLSLFTPKRFPRDREALALVSRLLQAASWQEVSMPELKELLVMYRSNKPPSIALIQHARVRGACGHPNAFHRCCCSHSILWPPSLTNGS